MVMIDISKPPVLVLARNPWLSGKLASVKGVTVKKAFVYKNPPPWSRFRKGEKALSQAQRQIREKFSAIAHETAGLSVQDRINRIKQAFGKLVYAID